MPFEKHFPISRETVWFPPARPTYEEHLIRVRVSAITNLDTKFRIWLWKPICPLLQKKYIPIASVSFDVNIIVVRFLSGNKTNACFVFVFVESLRNCSSLAEIYIKLFRPLQCTMKYSHLSVIPSSSMYGTFPLPLQNHDYLLQYSINNRAATLGGD